MMQLMWSEKYRPKTVDGYVFRDENQKKLINTWIKEKSIPHLLLSGSPGVGKTTLAKILLNEIGVEEYDILEINASRTNGVEEVRDLITNFVSMIPFGPFKAVMLDEADYLSHNAQAALRGVMEEYHETARFILTCNLPQKIMPAIHSRCQTFHIQTVDQTEFTARIATILISEETEFDLDVLDTFVKVTYPDLRKCINLVQQNVQDKKLINPNHEDAGQGDWKVAMVNLFKERKILEARKLICSSARPEEIGGIIRWLYDNAELFGNDFETVDQAILIIKQGLIDHAIIIDPEINLSAILIKLSRLVK